MASIKVFANDRFVRLNATGGETQIPYDFPVFAASEIRVRRQRDDVITTLALTTDYSIDGVGAEAGGNVNLNVAAVAGDVYDVDGEIAIARTTNFTTKGSFKADAVNRELNRLIATAQEIKREVDRSLRIGMGGPLIETELEGIEDIADGDAAVVEFANIGGVFTARMGSRSAVNVLARGAWATATSYSVNDLVENGGTSYIASAAHTSAAETEPGVGASWETVWVLFEVGGAMQALVSSVDNRLLRTSGTGGNQVDQTGITVDDSDNVSGLGDLQLTGDLIRRNVSTDLLGISGGNGAAIGANMRLYGSGHPLQASDIEIRTGGTVRARWDQSAAHWDFNGNTLFAVSNLIRGITNGSMFLSGGSATGLGANILLRGEAQAGEANDIIFRTGTTIRARWDQSANEWNFQGLGLDGVAAITRGADNVTLFLGSGSVSTLGANVILYGNTHATQADDIQLRSGTLTRLLWDNSIPRWDFQFTNVSNIQNLNVINAVNVGSGQMLSGTGTPEAVVTAGVGSIFMRTDGGAGASLYVKESGAGNTGWIAK